MVESAKGKTTASGRSTTDAPKFPSDALTERLLVEATNLAGERKVAEVEPPATQVRVSSQSSTRHQYVNSKTCYR